MALEARQLRARLSPLAARRGARVALRSLRPNWSHGAGIALRSLWPDDADRASIAGGTLWSSRSIAARIALGSRRTHSARIAFGASGSFRTSGPCVSLRSLGSDRSDWSRFTLRSGWTSDPLRPSWSGLPLIALVSLGAPRQGQKRQDCRNRDQRAHPFPPHMHRFPRRHEPRERADSAGCFSSPSKPPPGELRVSRLLRQLLKLRTANQPPRVAEAATSVRSQ